MSFMIAISVFLLGLTIVMALYFGLTEQPRSSWPSAAGAPRYRGPSSLARSSLQWSGARGKLLAWWVEKTAGADQDAPRVRQIHRSLTRAGFDQAQQFALYRAARIAAVVLAICAGLVGAHLYPRLRIPALLSGAIAGYLFPNYVIKRLGQKRQQAILHELPASLDLLAVTLEAGQGLLEAIKIVGRETGRQGRVLGHELTTAAAEMGAGVSLADSMGHLYERTGVQELKSITAVIIQSREIGGRLGPSLRAAAELLSAKRRLKAEEAAQKSSVKMLLPLVLLILPAMMIIILGPAIIQIFEIVIGAAS